MKYLVLACLLILVPVAVLADPDIGCGPGTQIWEGNSGIMPKVLGATTNGSFGMQTFGITFGTLGCRQGGTVTAQARVRMFADANIDRLARDMAHGGGETLDSFAQLIGVSESDKPEFFAFTQDHFADLFPGDEVTSVQMLTALNELMLENPHLATYAKL